MTRLIRPYQNMYILVKHLKRALTGSSLSLHELEVFKTGHNIRFFFYFHIYSSFLHSNLTLYLFGPYTQFTITSSIHYKAGHK